jgi:hypothetical protein
MISSNIYIALFYRIKILGGALMTNSDELRVLIGVNSFGSDQGCDAGNPSGFVKVSSPSVLQWIKSVINT